MRTYTNQFKTDCLGNSRRLAAEITINSLPTIHGSDYLKSINLVATPVDGKHFGYTICEKAIIKILPTYPSKASIANGATVVVKIGTANEKMQYQNFYIDTIDTDATSGEITLTCYDAMAKFNNYNWSSITFTDHNPRSEPYTINEIINKIISAVISPNATFLFDGTNLNAGYVMDSTTSTYEINAEQNMTLRTVLEDICEITGTIAVMGWTSLNNYDLVKFISLKGQDSLLNINNNHYYDCTIGNKSKLTGIGRDDGLGNTSYVGTTTCMQVMSNNVFIDLKSSSTITTIMNNIFSLVGNKDIYAYNMSWIGFNALEYGDSIKIDNTATYYLGENLTFDGGQKAECEWKADITQTTIENANNDINTALRRTEVKVDKANQKIELVVEDTNPPTVKRAAIVASINEGIPGTSIKIEADQVDLQGYTTFTNLSTAGETIINGSNITTGVINATSIYLHDPDDATSFSVDTYGNLTALGAYIVGRFVSAKDDNNETAMQPDSIRSPLGWFDETMTDLITLGGPNAVNLKPSTAASTRTFEIRGTVQGPDSNGQVTVTLVPWENGSLALLPSSITVTCHLAFVNRYSPTSGVIYQIDIPVNMGTSSYMYYGTTTLPPSVLIMTPEYAAEYSTVNFIRTFPVSGVRGLVVDAPVFATNIPQPPTINGNYNLRCNVNDGVVSYSWVNA